MTGSPPTRRLKHSDYTVAIICPLEVEMSAVRYMLDEEHAQLPEREGDPNSYIFGEMCGRNLVIGYLPEGFQGIGAATAVATHMQRSFPSAKLRLLIGIGGGIPSTVHDIRLGDVVIGMPEGGHGGVVQYDLGKESITGFVRKGHLDKPPQEWMTAIVKMKSDHRVLDNKISTFVAALRGKSAKLAAEYTPPKPETDIRSPSNASHNYLHGHNGCEKCEENAPVLTSARASIESVIFYGTIASGDRVIKSGEIRDKISKDISGALCFEMEAAGLMNNFRCVVIRGIADYADAHKNDDWHPWAAATAAACAKELLGYMVPIADSRKPKYSTVPKLRVKEFIGREKQISEIMAFFAAPRNVDEPRILILSAIGGQGKSQIALEYCRRVQSVYRGLFWVDASSQATTVRSLIRIAEVLDASASAARSDDENVQFVLDMAANSDERWLVVFDNYDDPKDFPAVKDFIPNGAEILFTSRHKDLDRLGEVLPVPSLLPDEEARLLLRNFKSTDTQRYKPAAQQIVDRLGHLALAIDQAAAYIQYRRIKLEDLDNFVETFDREREKILRYIPRDFWEYGSRETQNDVERKSLSAFTTWEISFHQLCRGNHVREEHVAHFLTICAYLAPIPVDEWLFQLHWELESHPPLWLYLFSTEAEVWNDFETAPCSTGHQTGNSGALEGVMEHSKKPGWDTTKFWDLIERAESLSLVQNASMDPELKAVKFKLHPLIRDWLQLRQKSEKRREFTKETIELLGNSIFALRRSQNVTANIKQNLVLHMDASVQNDEAFSGQGRRLGQENGGRGQAELFAWLYSAQGRFDRSYELWNVVCQTREAQLGPTHKDTLEAVSHMGEQLLDQYKYSAAERLLRDLLTTQRQVLGPEHGEVLTTMRMLARSLSRQGKYQEAETIFRAVLAVEQRLLDEQSWQRLSTMNSLAISLSMQHKLQEAEDVSREVYRIRQRVLDPEDVDMLTSKYNLAKIVSERGRIQEAQPMLEEVLEARTRLLGPSHPHTLQATNDLAFLLQSQGKKTEAERMYRDVLRSKESVLGRDHESTLVTAHQLALMSYELGQFDDAERGLRNVLERKMKVLGPGHRETLVTMESLGVLLVDSSCFDEAFNLLDQALAGFMRLWGPDHLDTVLCRQNYEHMLNLMGRQAHSAQQPLS